MRSTRFQGQDPLAQYSPKQRAWIERKAREIAGQTNWPLAVARAQAVAELRRTRDTLGAAPVTPSRRYPFNAV